MLLGVDGMWKKERGENETRNNAQSTEHRLISLVKEAGTGSTILLQGLKCKALRTRGHTYFSGEAFALILSAALFHSAFNVAPDFIPSTELAVWMISVVALAVVVADKMWKRTDGR